MNTQARSRSLAGLSGRRSECPGCLVTVESRPSGNDPAVRANHSQTASSERTIHRAPKPDPQLITIHPRPLHLPLPGVDPRSKGTLYPKGLLGARDQRCAAGITYVEFDDESHRFTGLQRWAGLAIGLQAPFETAGLQQDGEPTSRAIPQFRRHRVQRATSSVPSPPSRCTLPAALPSAIGAEKVTENRNRFSGYVIGSRIDAVHPGAGGDGRRLAPGPGSTPPRPVGRLRPVDHGQDRAPGLAGNTRHETSETGGRRPVPAVATSGPRQVECMHRGHCQSRVGPGRADHDQDSVVPGGDDPGQSLPPPPGCAGGCPRSPSARPRRCLDPADAIQVTPGWSRPRAGPRRIRVWSDGRVGQRLLAGDREAARILNSGCRVPDTSRNSSPSRS